jgi:UDP-N-acetyl-D-glucosamine dehydrogenase
MSTMFAQLQTRIASREATVGIIGLGYVGLPLAVAFASKGFTVWGIDTLSTRVKGVSDGISYIPDVPSDVLHQLVKAGTLQATGADACLSDCDVIIICVPTPLRKTKEPDISYIAGAAAQVAERLHAGQLIILESTTYPGTTEELLQPMVADQGFELGHDVFLAFSPERVDPGNPDFLTHNIPKVVGGVTSQCTDLAAALYGHIVSDVVPVSSPKAAEMVKLLENTFRSVNIALANEMALLCDKVGVDVWEVIEAAKTKPFGFMPFYPGPGLGGHCIPSDPIYLSWKARHHGYEARLIELAAQINGSMPQHVVEKAAELLNSQGKAMRDARILVLGVAYKRDVGDTRDSPALEIMQLLTARDAVVTYHDPYVPVLQIRGLADEQSIELTPDAVQAADCVLLLTDHGNVDYTLVAQSARLLLDTRNCLRAIPHDADIVRTL